MDDAPDGPTPVAAVIDIAAIERWARTELDERNAARELALRVSRELIRACATCIRAVHRHELERADHLLAQAHGLNRQMVAAAQDHGDIFWAGYVQDAQKELVEASYVSALLLGGPAPDPATLGVGPAPFLNGLGEVVGEIRRFLLDQLRRGDTSRGEPLLSAMDEIYSLLVALDYPDALTGGLRRTTDSVRGILEKTRGDLTFALRQDELQRALARSESRSQA